MRISIICLIACLQFGYGAKILFISPSITNSIIMFTGRMADVLVEAGHDVTFWIPEVMKTNKENGTKLAKIVRMNNITDSFEMIVNHKLDFFKDPGVPLLSHFHISKAFADLCEGILKRKDELDELAKKNFDLAFSDNNELCFIGLARRLNAKQHIYISTGELSDVVNSIGGVPQPLGAVPTFEDVLVGPAMNFWERLENVFMSTGSRLITAHKYWRQNEAFRRYYDPDFPALETLLRDSPLWFKGSDPFVCPAIPTLDKIINIAGVGITHHANLTGKFLDIVLRGRKGAVYFSLGTLTPTMNLDVNRRRALFNAFAAYSDYQFIVKITKGDLVSENLTRHIHNIQLVHWAPQTDLLAHPNVKLFISHGGMNSIFESAIRGKPMITIPLFYDQFRNAKGAEYRGYSLVLPKSDITVDNVKRAIDDVLNKPTYTAKAERLARLYWSKPHRPEEEIVRWTNFVLEHGALPELVPHGAYIDIIRLYCIDIFAIIGAICALLSYAIYRTTRFIIYFTCNIFVYKKSKCE